MEKFDCDQFHRLFFLATSVRFLGTTESGRFHDHPDKNFSAADVYPHGLPKCDGIFSDELDTPLSPKDFLHSLASHSILCGDLVSDTALGMHRVATDGRNSFFATAWTTHPQFPSLLSSTLCNLWWMVDSFFWHEALVNLPTIGR